MPIADTASLIIYFTLGIALGWWWHRRRAGVGRPQLPALTTGGEPAANDGTASSVLTRHEAKRAKRATGKSGPRLRRCPSDLELKMVLVVRKDLKLTANAVAMLAAQAAVESVDLIRSAPAAIALPPPDGDWHEWLRWWNEEGVAKVTLRVNDGAEFAVLVAAAMADGLPLAVATSTCGPSAAAAGGGAAATDAVVAIGPAPVDRINELTGHLKLL